MALTIGRSVGSVGLPSPAVLAGTVCGTAVVAIPAADLMLPASLHLLPLNAIPVLIGSRLLRRRGALILGIGAALAQIGKGVIDRSSAVTVLIAIATVLGVAFLAHIGINEPQPRSNIECNPEPPTANDPAAAAVDRLSRREKEIVLLTLDGLTALRVAETLFISKRTVETHLASAYRKLGVTSKLQLVSRRANLTGHS